MRVVHNPDIRIQIIIDYKSEPQYKFFLGNNLKCLEEILFKVP